jgi:UDP-2,3-diacylglucosamine hydrolase
MQANEIHAPPSWRCVDFISDVHLHPSSPENFSAWAQFLGNSEADAIFILGDLFDVWIGDDVLTEQSGRLAHSMEPDPQQFERDCVQHLHACAQQRSVYLMHGNRDFLIGPRFSQATGAILLNDPSVLVWGGHRYLLSHGDALCLADTAYQDFRRVVRDDAWQSQFLATSLSQRREQARMMRARSESVKDALKASGQAWVDVDQAATLHWMNALACHHFIHGHTHEGRDHALVSNQGQGIRHVLPDWHVEQTPPQGFALRLELSAEGHILHKKLPVA